MAARALALDQMYRVLRGLPGSLPLRTPEGADYVLTVVNPNAPANRCQETLGLSVTLDGPLGAKSAGNRETVEHVLSENDLAILRTGAPLALTFGTIALSLQSNPGGHLIELGEDDDHATR